MKLSRSQLFYQKNNLQTFTQSHLSRTLFSNHNQALAEYGLHQLTNMLSTDFKKSITHIPHEPHTPRNYNVYGHVQAIFGSTPLLGFNGEFQDPLTGCYLLGAGYRCFNPVLMRFQSPDNQSPFARGGLNGYAFCNGDPINKSDPSGNQGVFSFVRKLFNHVFKRHKTTTSEASNLASRHETTENDPAIIKRRKHIPTTINNPLELIDEQSEYINALTSPMTSKKANELNDKIDSLSSRIQSTSGALIQRSPIKFSTLITDNRSAIRTLEKTGAMLH